MHLLLHKGIFPKKCIWNVIGLAGVSTKKRGNKNPVYWNIPYIGCKFNHQLLNLYCLSVFIRFSQCYAHACILNSRCFLFLKMKAPWVLMPWWKLLSGMINNLICMQKQCKRVGKWSTMISSKTHDQASYSAAEAPCCCALPLFKILHNLTDFPNNPELIWCTAAEQLTISLWSPTNVEHPCTNFPFFLMQKSME